MTVIDRRYSVAEGQAIKAPCAAATTANILLAGAQTIDGVALTETSPPMRVLVKNQTIASQNGIYDVSSGNWTRSRDFDGAYDVVTGTLVRVAGGSTNIGYWQVTTTGTITIDTTSLTFAVTTNQITGMSAYFETLIGLGSASAILAAFGDVSFVGTMALAGNLAINTNKFSVAAASGNTNIAGTLGVTGATTLTGAATLSSTLGVTGAATLSSTLGVAGNLAVNTDKFTVAAASGNTAVAGTLAVSGTATFSDVVTGPGLPKGFADIDSAGTITDSANVTSCVRNSTGNYTVTLPSTLKWVQIMAIDGSHPITTTILSTTANTVNYNTTRPAASNASGDTRVYLLWG